MKKTFLLLITLSLAITSQAQITFEEGTWDEIKAKAKKAKKMIFVDAYTTWCGPCKWLSANVFTDKAVGEHHNAQYINYKLDMEKGEGPKFAQDFGVAAYPTLLYFNKDGELAHRLVGALPADQFLVKTKEATEPNKQYYTLLKKYEKGERKVDFLRNIAQAAESAGIDNAGQILKEYLKVLPKKDWEKPENLKFIGMAATSFDSEEFKVFEKNKDKMTTEEFQTVIFGLLDKEMNNVVKSRDVAKMKEMQAKITKYLPEQAPTLNKNVEKYFNQAIGNTSNIAESEDWSELNEAAWKAYEKETDKGKLEQALGWAKKSIEIEENFYNTDTYAHLAHKLGKKEDALKWAEKAIQLGKAAGEDTTETEKLIKKIKNGE